MTSFGRLLLGAALLLGGASPALACTCDDAREFDAAAVERAARTLVRDGYVVAEVERMDAGAPTEAQQYRVRRTLLGPAPPGRIIIPPAVVRTRDGNFVPVPPTSCEWSVPPAFKGKIMLRPAGPAPARTCSVLPSINDSGFRLAGLCMAGLLDNPRIVARAAALYREGAEAGVRRSSRPPSSSR